MLYDNLSSNAAGHLIFAGIDTTEMADKYGTPLLLMDEQRIRSHCREYRKAMDDFLPAGSKPLYASKALSFKGMYRIMEQEGMGIDVVSPGELHTAVRAGFPMENAYFHGNSKTDEDIRFAMDNGIGCIVCDNADEMDVIDAEAEKHGIRQRVLLRLSPGIDPHTHEKISTGKIDCKFGAVIENGQAEKLVAHTLEKKNVDLQGYHCHIGSQIFEAQPFCDAAVIMLRFIAHVRNQYGHMAAVLNLGGGMGVPYVRSHSAVDYTANIRAIGVLITETCAQLGIPQPKVLMEPGRSIVADAGITLYRVTGIKAIPGFKNYVAVDGGMTDNPRYTLYQSDYTVLMANRTHDAAESLYTVAGRCCESGDLIQENVALPEPHRGDLLAVLTTGAYNYSMASNYNRIPRPPVVMVSEGHDTLAVRRETYEDLILYDM